MSTLPPQPPAPFAGGVAAGIAIQHGQEQMEEMEQNVSGSIVNDDSATPVESDELRDKEIQDLARTFSRLSQEKNITGVSEEAINTFLDPTQDPELDPNSPEFSSRKWVRNTLQMTRDPARFPRRTAGVSFKNLNVFGYGTAADYQLNFANIWLKMFDGARHLFGLGKKVRIDILRNFEGLVDHGEMLVVLGRPGR